MKIKFKNFLGTIESFIRNDATVVRNYQFQDRDGTIADSADLDLKTDKAITANRQTGSYTLALTDASKLVEMNVASANNLTVPPNSSVAFPIGAQILVSQYGAGQTSLVAGSGVTIRSDAGKLKITVQYGAATLVKIGTNEWYLFGNITA